MLSKNTWYAQQSSQEPVHTLYNSGEWNHTGTVLYLSVDVALLSPWLDFLCGNSPVLSSPLLRVESNAVWQGRHPTVQTHLSRHVSVTPQPVRLPPLLYGRNLCHTLIHRHTHCAQTHETHTQVHTLHTNIWHTRISLCMKYAAFTFNAIFLTAVTLLLNGPWPKRADRI